MKINQLKTGVIISYCTQAVNILSGLIYTPVMLRLLGQSEYGLYQLVYSVVSYLGLLSLGFNGSYVRFYSRYKAKDDERGITGLNGMYLTIFLALATLCIILGTIMTAGAEMIFGSGLTPEELGKAKVLMEIMVINIALTFVNSVFISFITAHERFFFQKLIEFLRVLFNPFLTLPLLLLGYGSVGMVAVTTLLTLAALLSNLFYAFKKLHMQISFTSFKFSLLKEMSLFTVFVFINMIVDQINWSVGKFLLGRFLGTTAVAVFGVAGQLNSMYLVLANAVSGVFVPRVNKIVATTNDNHALTTLFTRVGRIQFLILGLVITGYIFFGQEFILFWAGEGYREAYVIGLLLMVPVTVPMVQTLGIEIQRAKNMHKARSVMYLFMAVVNVLISIPCIQYFGASGAAFGTALSLIIGNGLLMNWYYHKKIGLDIFGFWKQILRFLPAMVIPVATGIVLRMFFPLGTIIGLGLAMALYCAIYALSMFLFGMNRSEKDLIILPVKKVLHK